LLKRKVPSRPAPDQAPVVFDTNRGGVRVFLEDGEPTANRQVNHCASIFEAEPASSWLYP